MGTNFIVCFVIDWSDNCSLQVFNFSFFFFLKNSGTQLLKKVAATPVKPLSQTKNAVASTVQPPAVIQVGGMLYSKVE